MKKKLWWLPVLAAVPFVCSIGLAIHGVNSVKSDMQMSTLQGISWVSGTFQIGDFNQDEETGMLAGYDEETGLFYRYSNKGNCFEYFTPEKKAVENPKAKVVRTAFGLWEKDYDTLDTLWDYGDWVLPSPPTFGKSKIHAFDGKRFVVQYEDGSWRIADTENRTVKGEKGCAYRRLTGDIYLESGEKGIRVMDLKKDRDLYTSDRYTDFFYTGEGWCGRLAGGSWEALDKDFQVISERLLEEPFRYHEGVAGVYFTDGTSSYVDKNFRSIRDFQTPEICLCICSEGKMIAVGEKKTFCFDRSGREIFSMKNRVDFGEDNDHLQLYRRNWENDIKFSAGLAPVVCGLENGWNLFEAVIDEKGGFVIEPCTCYFVFYGRDYIGVYGNDFWGLGRRDRGIFAAEKR